MTSRETIIANIEHSADDRIGFNFAGVRGRRNDFASAGCEHGIEIKKWTEGGFEFYTDIWGNIWKRIIGKSESGEVHEAALEDWSDLDSFELPDLANPRHFESARALGGGDNERFRCGHFWGIGWIFTIPESLRRMDTYLMDMIAYPSEVAVLHDRIAELLEGIIEQYGEAGLDGIMFGEDLGLQDRLILGKSRWNEVFRPYYERLTAKAHTYGMKVIQHTCGFNWELIDDLCDSGIDCLQFDQPCVYDLPALAAKLTQHRVGLFSPCDIQTVLPTGDRKAIESHCRQTVELFRGGFIAKNYPDLLGIGVTDEWDEWAYRTFEGLGA